MSQDDKTDDPQGQPPPPQGAKKPGEAAAEAGVAFKQGMGLLWQAAVAATEEIKREVDRAEVSDTLQQAGRDLETAAQQAAQALEGFIDRVNAGGKKPPTGDHPFPQGGPAAAPPPANAEGEDGGVDEDGNRRDVRIQLEEDK